MKTPKHVKERHPTSTQKHSTKLISRAYTHSHTHSRTHTTHTNTNTHTHTHTHTDQHINIQYTHRHHTHHTHEHTYRPTHQHTIHTQSSTSTDCVFMVCRLIKREHVSPSIPLSPNHLPSLRM